MDYKKRVWGGSWPGQAELRQRLQPLAPIFVLLLSHMIKEDVIVLLT